MSDLSLWLALAALPVLLFLYVRANDAKITLPHPAAVALSPERWTLDEVKRTAEAQEARVGSSPSLFAPEELPPKTGRRYIVVGGVSALFPVRYVSWPVPVACTHLRHGALALRHGRANALAAHANPLGTPRCSCEVAALRTSGNRGVASEGMSMLIPERIPQQSESIPCRLQSVYS